MSKVWILDTETKGTGAHVAPLEKTRPESEPRERPRRSRERSRSTARPARRESAKARETSAAPLPAGHVRKKATGEIGRVQSVDPRAGTATVRWLRSGTISTVPLTAVARH